MVFADGEHKNTGKKPCLKICWPQGFVCKINPVIIIETHYIHFMSDVMSLCGLNTRSNLRFKPLGKSCQEPFAVKKLSVRIQYDVVLVAFVVVVMAVVVPEK